VLCIFASLVFTKDFEDCIHLLATRRIINNFDREHGVSAASILDQTEDHDYAQDATKLVSSCP
jgi:hypothetical protein